MGEEGPLHFLVQLLWEELEAGLCGLVSDGKRKTEREKKNSLLKNSSFSLREKPRGCSSAHDLK